MVYGHPLPDFVKNTRNEVINLMGELNNPTHRSAAVNIGGAAETAITITLGKRTMRITNIGTKDIYYGATGVTSVIGTPIFSNGESVTFANVKDNFVVYLRAATGDTSEIRLVEF